MPRFFKYCREVNNQKLPNDPYKAIQDISRYPSLIERFARKGYCEIDRIENDLVVKHLTCAQRKKLSDRLAQLTHPDHDVWENTIASTHYSHFDEIDNMINQWLDEPVDWGEQDLFDPIVLDDFYKLRVTRNFLTKIHRIPKAYLGVQLNEYTITQTDESQDFYSLSIPIKEANRRAKALGLKLRFEH